MSVSKQSGRQLGLREAITQHTELRRIDGRPHTLLRVAFAPIYCNGKFRVARPSTDTVLMRTFSLAVLRLAKEGPTEM